MDTALTASLVRPPHNLQPLKTTYRINSIDLLRGAVMVIMALDHTRDFFHKTAWTADPLNLAATTPYLFFTRWITHFCAPVFVFLAGTSARFQTFKKTRKQLSWFLLSRGLWLVLVEVVIMNFAFSFDPHFTFIALLTIWSIAISMILLGLAIWLPFGAILTLGVIIVMGHNSLDFYEAGQKGALPFWYSLLHRPGFYTLWKGHSILILYPFLSWTGLMMLGYCFGKLFAASEGVRRKKILTWLGLGIILFFIALRATNLYGDPAPWSSQKNLLYTIFSFINTQKYPSSLLFMSMTIGPAILFIARLGESKTKFSEIISVYGRVPLFYYVLHFFLIHFLSMIFFLARGHSLAEGMKPQSGFLPQFVDPSEGYPLGLVYLIWFAIVASLYPLCKWFSEYKRIHKEKWWLSYL